MKITDKTIQELRAMTNYATGEVNVIKTDFYDAADVLVRTRRIKHYCDGRQPEAS